MIQAIVFLPLLGAILAGIISLAGARARHPGGLDVDHGPEHQHYEAVDRSAPVHGAAGVIESATHEPDAQGHDAHEVHPRAAGSRLAELVTTIPLLICAALSWVVLVNVGF